MRKTNRAALAGEIENRSSIFGPLMQDLIQDQELEAREYLMKSILLKGKVMGTAGAINPDNGSE
jgi:hypothetical protein